MPYYQKVLEFSLFAGKFDKTSPESLSLVLTA